MSDSKKKWVYRSRDGGEFTLVVRSRGTRVVRDTNGNEVAIAIPPIRIPFVGGFAVIDEVMAEHHKLSLEDLVAAIEGQSSFGGTFICVQSPQKAITKEELTKLEDKDKDKKKVVKGARSRGTIK